MDIQNKTNLLEKYYLLVNTLNMNNDDIEAKFSAILTKIIRKFTDFFFIIFGEKHQQIFPWKNVLLKKKSKLTRSYGLINLQLDNYPPYSDKQSDILRQIFTKTFRYIHWYTDHVENIYIGYFDVKK